MNILGMGPMEIVLIVVLALIVFGPAKLPEIMGQVGKAISDFRRATSELSDEFNRTIQAELQETRSVVEDTKSAVTGVHSSINAAITGTPATPTLTTPVAAAAQTNGASNGTNGTNGTSDSKPPLADTAQWSWETAAPAPAVPAVQVAEPEPATAVAAPEPGPSDGVAPTGQAPAPEFPAPKPGRNRKTTGRDDLLPPY
jgi:TatA/E family protein of Tat protein translocase